MYLVALNCGSSSIKGKLFALDKGHLDPVASVSVSNIGAADDNVSLKIGYKGREDVSKDLGKGSEIEHRDVFPKLLDLFSDTGEIDPKDIKYITHRIVHGGENRKGLRVTSGHTEALEEMDALSAFAPLHNHHAVLCVRACLETLPDATNLLLFDTLFHQTLAPDTYTYALPPGEKTAIPLRKYGFHGLSYASIVNSLAKKLNKKDEEVNIVVAHLGSGASACCIEGGKSIDTSMGLTPLEGLVGGTRTGTIDPTAIFHHTKDYAEDAGLKGIKVTKAEYILNKKSGLVAMAGTQNFGQISKDAFDERSENHKKAKLAYDVFVDRLMGYLSQYVFKLAARVGGLENVHGVVFSGGIGENADGLRKEVMARFGWLGVKAGGEPGDGVVEKISGEGSSIPFFVVKTDEEGWCAHLAREELDF